MPDHKPPRLVGDERTTLQALLQFQRESIVRKVEGLDDAAARLELVPTGTSLLWLIKHLTRAERLWVERRFAGRDVGITDDRVSADDTVASAVTAYRATWAEMDAIVGDASLDDVSRDTSDSGDESPVNLRWILGHLLEETARHAGHADILREQIDGDTGR
ncbi:MAG: DinB family protein [Actinobacteria bacterium]|nr:DinB family protein [Actinomycetota bacterium]